MKLFSHSDSVRGCSVDTRGAEFERLRLAPSQLPLASSPDAQGGSRGFLRRLQETPACLQMTCDGMDHPWAPQAPRTAPARVWWEVTANLSEGREYRLFHCSRMPGEPGGEAKLKGPHSRPWLLAGAFPFALSFHLWGGACVGSGPPHLLITPWSQLLFLV